MESVFRTAAQRWKSAEAQHQLVEAGAASSLVQAGRRSALARLQTEVDPVALAQVQRRPGLQTEVVPFLESALETA